MPVWTGPSRSTDFKHCSSVPPHRRRYTFDDTHSIDVPNSAGLDWKTALTFGPKVFDVLHSAIENAPKALGAANRQDCPVPPRP